MPGWTILGLLLRRLMRERMEHRTVQVLPPDVEVKSAIPTRPRRLARICIRLEGLVDAELTIPADLSPDEVRQLVGVITANAKANPETA